MNKIQTSHWQVHLIYWAQLNSSLNNLKTRNPKMDTLAISEDPDEMPHNAAFYLGLHWSIFIERNTMFLEIITCDPSMYI